MPNERYDEIVYKTVGLPKKSVFLIKGYISCIPSCFQLHLDWNIDMMTGSQHSGTGTHHVIARHTLRVGILFCG